MNARQLTVDEVEALTDAEVTDHVQEFLDAAGDDLLPRIVGGMLGAAPADQHRAFLVAAAMATRVIHDEQRDELREAVAELVDAVRGLVDDLRGERR